MKNAPLLTIAFTVIAATAVFYAVVHQVSGAWLDVMLRPEVRDALEHSLADQKALRAHDRANEERYRKRFEETRRLLNRIDVIAMNREAVLRRFETTLAGAFAITLAGATLLWSIRQRRADARRRTEYLERLSAWQEASRRHAHEIKTPLSAARLEVDRLASLTSAGAPREEIAGAVDSVYEELDRITRFTKEFSSFAAIGTPVLRPEPLDRIVAEFCTMFANAWPNLTLRFASTGETIVQVDRDLLRQVLVNLCTNSSHATAERGTVTFTIVRDGSRVCLDVADTGTGIPPSIRPRIFEPYVTTRQIGAGMGLGLPISRKILLDHGGDLTLVSTSSSGTTFRLSFV